MYTEPKIITTSDLNYRSYVMYHHNGKRYREYNGRKINLSIYPNHSKNLKDKDRLLKKLKFEIQKNLEAGWNPSLVESRLKKFIVIEPDKVVYKTGDLLKLVIKNKLNSSLSASYKRDLNSVGNQFLEFLTAEEKEGTFNSISPFRIEQFLQQFNTSGTYYMNKRRNLGVVFSDVIKLGVNTPNPIMDASKKKVKSTLHKIYTSEQLRSVLKFLKEQYPNLYLCCLLTFGCFLRPHQETRLLKVSNIKKDLTQIQLSGDENKSGRVRVVQIPEYVQEALIARNIDFTQPDINVISNTKYAFNESYFNTQWSRAKVTMIKKGMLEESQTIYSFRHTAAVQVYKKTKDIHILQQLLGHSNMIVTLTYLRGLGELNTEKLIEAMPELY